MKQIYLLSKTWWPALLLCCLLPFTAQAQVCDEKPLNIPFTRTDWTTNCSLVAANQCDITNGPNCSSNGQTSNWLLLNPSLRCASAPPCNAVGLRNLKVRYKMKGTYFVKNVGNLNQTPSLAINGCMKVWADNQLVTPFLTVNQQTTLPNLAPNQTASGNLNPVNDSITNTDPDFLATIFGKACAGQLCFDALADGYTTVVISNGNLEAQTTLEAALEVCLNYNKYTYSITGTEVACEGANNGKIFLTFTRATGTSLGDYRILVDTDNNGSWDVVQQPVTGANTISNLPAGTYPIAIYYNADQDFTTLPPSTSAAGCGFCKESVTVGEAKANITCNTKDDCPGSPADGSVGVTVTGTNLGTVTYAWSANAGSATTSTVSPVAAGTYTVTVTYGPGGKCQKIHTCTVNNAPGVDFTATPTPVVCKGQNNGKIEVDPTSGTGPFTIKVTGKTDQTSTNGESKTFTGFGPGAYTVTVIDKNGCEKSVQVDITEPAVITADLDIMNALCNGVNNGMAEVTNVAGGNGGYTYTWSRGTPSPANKVSNLSQGSISVTITDSKGCTLVKTGNISRTKSVSIMCTPTKEGCDGANDGSVSITITNGTAPYTITSVSGPSFTTVTTSSNPAVVSNLADGSYTVKVTDDSGCEDQCTFTIAKGETFTCEVTGPAQVCPEGGVYTYTANTVSSATYSWALVNNTMGASITAPSATNTVSITVPNNATGTVDVEVTITKSGCVRKCIRTVMVGPPVNFTATLTPVVCNGQSNGEIVVDPTTGTAPFTIKVTGQSDQTSTSGEPKTFTGLAAATYTVQVIDKNGCSKSIQVPINQPGPITAELSTMNAECNGVNNGMAQVTNLVGGNTGTFSYNWSRGSASPPDKVSNLSPGPIAVTITDSKGCFIVKSGAIGQNRSVSIACTPTKETCDEANDGSVSIQITNGTAPFDVTYVSGPTSFTVINTSANPAVVTGLANGTYTVKVKDATGCEDQCTFKVDQGETFTCSVDGPALVCKEGSTSVYTANVVPGATYSWALVNNSMGATITTPSATNTVSITTPNNATGSVEVEVTISLNGCVKKCFKKVEVRTETPCNLGGPNAVCVGGSVTITSSGASAPFSWSVSNGLLFTGQGTSSITVSVPSNSVLTQFTVTLTSIGAGGCQTTCTKTVTINPLPTVTLTVKDPVCTLVPADGVLTATATSGTAPFTYRLYKSSPRALFATFGPTNNVTHDFTGLGLGDYDVEIIDANGCTSDPTATITLITPVNFNPIFDCAGQANPITVPVVLNITGGTGPFMYSLDNFTFSPVPVTGIITVAFTANATLSIYVKDSRNCPAVKKDILLVCCELSGVCKLTTPAPLVGCDTTAIPGPKTKVSDVFSNVTFCKEARIAVDTTRKGSLCDPKGFQLTYSYTLYDDINDNDKLDGNDVIYEDETCEETYTMTRPEIKLDCPGSLEIFACQTPAQIQKAIDDYKAKFSFTGGCNATASFSNISIPTQCQQSVVTITYTVKGKCGDIKSCDQTITFKANPAITLTCNEDSTVVACTSQATINDRFAKWLRGFSVSGGCNDTSGQFDGTPTAPNFCGGTVTVTYRVVDPFNCSTESCTKTFTVAKAPSVVLNCPANKVLPSCLTAKQIQDSLDAYKTKFSFSGGCGATASFNNVNLPSICNGGTVTLTYTVNSDCEGPKRCEKTFEVTKNPTITLTCNQDTTIAACTSQATIDDLYAKWLRGFSVTGGCAGTQGEFTAKLPAAPNFCGGTVTVTYRVVDPFNCKTESCTKTFTVTKAPPVVLTCPANKVLPSCLTAKQIQDSLDAYKTKFSFSGGCGATASFNNVNLPSICDGGTVTLTYTVNSACEGPKICEKTFKVTKNPAITLTCNQDTTIAACTPQATIDALYAKWLRGFSVTGGCAGTKGEFTEEVSPPYFCGGTVSVTYQVVDPFGCNKESCTRAFKVESAPDVVLKCPTNKVLPSCLTAKQIKDSLDAYKAKFSFTGGCGAKASFNEVDLPSICKGGTVTLTYSVSSDCEERRSCSQTFTVTKNPDITFVCNEDTTLAACTSQAAINDLFDKWLRGFSVSGGCEGTRGSFVGSPVAPNLCGGTVTVTYRVDDPFDCDKRTCTKTFTVNAAPKLELKSPDNLTLPSCLTEQQVKDSLDKYKTKFSFTGGCNSKPSFSEVSIPNVCKGGVVTITYTVVSDCETKFVNKTITRQPNPEIKLTCNEDTTIAACTSQAEINNLFAKWLRGFKVEGGCAGTEGAFDGNPTAPNFCGGTVTVTYRVVDPFQCNTEFCTRTFTVTKAPPVITSVPEGNLTIPACTPDDKAADLIKAYLDNFTASGGCGLQSSISEFTKPPYCGGSVKFKFTVTSACAEKEEYERSIIRTAPDTVKITCAEEDLLIPASLTDEEAQEMLDEYKKQFSFTGGCDAKASFDNPSIPDVCTGGDTTLTYTVVSTCDKTKTCTVKIIREANPIPDIFIGARDSIKIERCEGDTASVLFEIEGTQDFYDIEYSYMISILQPDCSYKTETDTVLVEKVESGNHLIKLSDLKPGTYMYTFERAIDPFGCSYGFPPVSDKKKVTITVHPKPVGKDTTKTLYTCLPVNVNLQNRVRCNVPSTFKWYSVQTAGSSTPYDNPSITGETITPSGMTTVINDVLTNLTNAPQTIIYRVEPTSTKGCAGEAFYVTVKLVPAPNIQCLACMTTVNVSMDKKCKFFVTPDLVMDGFKDCPNGDFLLEALEVIIGDGNSDSYVDCPGTYKYVIKLKEGYDLCYKFTPCWGTIVAEDKLGPNIDRVDFTKNPIYCFDINFALNNPKTVGATGVKPSFPQSLSDNTPGHSILSYSRTVPDEVLNLGAAYFSDNCKDCGCNVSVKWYDRLVTYGCDSLAKNGLWARIYREWVATDCRGMTKDTTQVIEVRRPKVSQFAWKNPKPNKPYDQVVEYQACTADKSLIKKEDWMPRIASTFYSNSDPKLERWLYLDEVECNYSVQIKDTEFPVCDGKGVKIDREIYVFDWCAGGIIDTLHVLIKIGDFKAPTITAKTPVTISTGPMNCTASIPTTAARLKSDMSIDISDNCSLGNVSIRIKTRDRIVKGIIIATNVWDEVQYPVMNGVMSGLPLGRHRMIIDAFDGCYNAVRDSVEFDVVDKIAPVMKCDDDLNVTLSNANGYLNGYARVTAKDIDEGSFDNCELKWIKVRRTYNADCKADLIAKGYDLNGDGELDDKDGFTLVNGKWMTPLADAVEFFCCDITEPVTVELWGEDWSGNRNFCWMTLNLEDKVAPTCQAPENVTIYCDDKNLGTIDSKIQSALAFGDVTITSGNDCGKLDTAYRVVKNLKCGYGTIERIWTLTKKTVKGDLTTECKQIIRIVPVHEYDILLPRDLEVRDCTKPVADTLLVDERFCDILAVNITDKRYDASNDECYKIFRTYTVINWCTYDDRCGDPMDPRNVFVIDRKWTKNGLDKIWLLVRDPNRTGKEDFILSYNRTPYEGDLNDDILSERNPLSDERIRPPFCDISGEFHHSFMYTQIIKVYDDVAPVISFKRDTFCTSPVTCLANVKIPFTATDNCTDRLELERTQVMVAPFQTVTGPYIMANSRDYIFSFEDDGKGKMAVSVTNLPEGLHDLIVVVRDECGNLTRPTRIPFLVRDCKAPAPICINGLSTELMPDGNGGGMMAVWANDFIASKIYDCNGQGPETQAGLKLVTKYSINRVGQPVKDDQTGLTFTCADKGKVINVEIHAWDSKGNHDFCVTFVEIQDNRKVCPTGGTNDDQINGIIATDDAKPVQGVDVSVSGDKQDKQTTPGSGLYGFNSLLKGGDYTITPQLDKDAKNGVSTFDLILIQKHILGIQLLSNPYRQIAADVNGSKTITTLDLIQIRKLILNIDDSFKGSPSWKFVDAKYQFAEPTNPWKNEVPEVVNVNDLDGKVQADFVAIKMGDVNGSAATIPGATSSEVRSGKDFILNADEQQMKAGQLYDVLIKASDLSKVQGFQFTLGLQNAEIVGIDYGVMKAENFGIFAKQGMITGSWNSANGTATSAEGLFTLKLRATKDQALSEVLNISSRMTAQEAYGQGDEIMDLKLSFGRAEQLGGQARLDQNQPNPFAEETLIGFYLPKAAQATITVRDVKGALVYRTQGDYAKGMNQVKLGKQELKAAGVLYYTLETADFTATKKMVVLTK